MAYVSTNSELFKVIKRELYAYVEGRAQQAKEMGKEFTRPIFGDAAIQVLIEVLKKRRDGKTDAEVPTVAGKVNYALRAFFTQFLDDVLSDAEGFVRTAITLPRREQDAFLRDVKALAAIPPVRRHALLDVIRTLLPKVEGLRMRSQLHQALDRNDAGQFIEFSDVAEVDENDEPAER